MRGSEAAERRLVDAVAGIVDLADRKAAEPGAVAEVARHEAAADERHAGIRRGQNQVRRAEEDRCDRRSPTLFHDVPLDSGKWMWETGYRPA